MKEIEAAFKAGYHCQWVRDERRYSFDPTMTPGDPDGAYRAWRNQSTGEPMTLTAWDDFIRAISREGLDNLAYSVVGLCGESGEVAEWYKKTTMRTHTTSSLTDQDLKEELGDVQHYLTRIALAKGWTTEECMVANQAKLEKRYGCV